MTLEEKKNLDAIKKIHLDGVAHPLKDRERCYICFLLTLLDQAHRDTERLVVLTDRAFHKELSENNHYWELRDLVVNYKKEHFAEALDQAALARGEGEK